MRTRYRRGSSRHGTAESRSTHSSVRPTIVQVVWYACCTWFVAQSSAHAGGATGGTATRSGDAAQPATVTVVVARHTSSSRWKVLMRQPPGRWRETEQGACQASALLQCREAPKCRPDTAACSHPRSFASSPLMARVVICGRGPGRYDLRDGCPGGPLACPKTPSRLRRAPPSDCDGSSRSPLRSARR